MLGRPQRFRFKNRLLSLDSTTTLSLALFPWARYRQAKGGVKLHVLLSHEYYLPEYALLTDARQHDIRPARQILLRAGSIMVMDRGYNDFALFGKWTEEGVFWVTRMKERTAYAVEESRELPQGRSILADDIVRLTGAGAAQKCPERLRRIVVWDAESEDQIVLLSNHMEFGATTLADIYR